MPSALAFYRWTELDRTTWPAFRDAAGAYEDGAEAKPRAHPGTSTLKLPTPRARRLVPLDRSLASRRSSRTLGSAALSERDLGHLLHFAHGAIETGGRGPVPSAGGLQALELYVVRFGDGAYHYDRAGHALSKLGAAERAEWRTRVPSLDLVEGGSTLFVIAGDVGRVEPKYGARGLRFLLLEAGHLMQNLCVLSASLKRATVPMGAFFEKDVAAALGLPGTDLVLYAGLCG